MDPQTGYIFACVYSTVFAYKTLLNLNSSLRTLQTIYSNKELQLKYLSSFVTSSFELCKKSLNYLDTRAYVNKSLFASSECTLRKGVLLAYRLVSKKK